MKAPRRVGLAICCEIISFRPYHSKTEMGGKRVCCVCVCGISSRCLGKEVTDGLSLEGDVKEGRQLTRRRQKPRLRVSLRVCVRAFIEYTVRSWNSLILYLNPPEDLYF